MGESHAPERKCEEGVEERVAKFEMVGKEEQDLKEEEEEERMEKEKEEMVAYEEMVEKQKEKEMEMVADEEAMQRIEKAKLKVKLWLTNNFGEPDIIELMIPAR